MMANSVPMISKLCVVSVKGLCEIGQLSLGQDVAQWQVTVLFEKLVILFIHCHLAFINSQ